MRIVKMQMKSVSPISFGGMPRSPMKKGESHDDYDKRVWMERASEDGHGNVVVKGMALQRCIQAAAKKYAIKKKGMATFTKNFEGGIMAMGDMHIGVRVADLVARPLLLNSDGIRGSGKRVERIIPHVLSWSGEIEFAILDDEIRVDDFESTVKKAGIFVGVGQFRPENLGINGRFEVEKFEWRDASLRDVAQ